MIVLVVILAVGVFAYFVWRVRTSSLSRDCRWRQHRARHVWECTYCGALSPGDDAPRQCLRGQNGASEPRK